MKLIRKPAEEAGNDSSAGGFLFKLIPYWPLFLLLLIIALLSSWFYIKITTPVFKTTARILIKDQTKQGDAPKTFEALDIISPKKTIDNEIEVIQSKNLVATVVNDLSLYAPVFLHGTFRDELAYNISPIVISTNDINSLRNIQKVKFTMHNSNVIINSVPYPLNKLSITPYGNLIFSINKHLSQPRKPGTEFYFSILSPRKVTEALSQNLKASSANKLSTIIDLELTDQNSDRGEDILNDLIKDYNLSITNEKNQLAANTERFINARLTNVENVLLNIEHKQQTYQANRGAIDVGTQGKLFLENVSSNDQSVSKINMQLAVLKQIENYIKSSSLNDGIVPSTAGVDDPGLTEMVKNVYELQLEAESLKKTTGENNPQTVSITDKIEKIRPQILQNLANQRQSLLVSKRNLSSTNQNYSNQLNEIPETQKNLVDIDRELNIESGIYTYLLQKKEETALSFIVNEDAAKMVQSPESSDSPVSPKSKIIYLSSVLLASLLGISFVSGRENIRPNIMYQKDIEKLTQIPVISELSSGNYTNPIVIGTSERTLIAEQFRRLRTTINYLGIGGDKKRILITSAISGEGKSFVAVNLAVSLALTKKRVALLDFDLNNPSLHIKLNISKGIGITDYLQGKADAESIIKDSLVSPNLSFLSAGNLDESPSELITSDKPKQLLDYLDEHFDYIIIDVAPVGPISDAYILSPLCDATLYVVRHAFTPKTFIERLDKNNELNNLKNAAIVFNAVSSRSFGNYGFGYGYGYVYSNKHDQKRLN